jgi:hypothetical protein
MATTYQETRGRVVLIGTNGEKQKPKVLPEKSYGDVDWIKEREEEGFSVEVEVAQTHTYHQVSVESAFADFEILVPNPDERADLINTAIALKQQQYVRKQLLASEFVPVEGSIDLIDVVGAVTERQKMSPEQKAANALSKMLGRAVTVDQLNDILSQLQTA